MSEQSRRRFLVAAGASTVAVGAGAILAAGPAAAHSEPAKAAAPTTRDDDLAPADTKVVAYVSDPAHDEVTLMVDDRESVIQDRVLARALARAAREQVG
ncbi:twin-arginine translocation signal domain-containing protein [Jiangella alkaliphila]|uniref:Tat (Twin-arginine translocation) pathway signal sequence n=1 Tax=Jiangella alkaliphila TaxID=419479 RepID=A0A1H2LFI1_9ACTN|nr:twin-arginine translocation signal domain-containing protein [Jiangella alkaliphila]SDU79584.1 Tat (twin-arginine translocation) pathway signal sequence [Jiangella alkaliphila]